MPQWTNEQRQAIEVRGSNLLVAAAAGSGKTAVLVERIIRILIQDGVDIDRLLIVTFTNAAAGEMRERIGAALIKALDEKEGDEEHLRRQINLLGKASISTLHAFCISVIRRYFHVIRIDPDFRIGDETETAILKMEAMEALLEEEYGKGNEDFLGLVERFGGVRQDTPLQELVLRLYDFIQSKPYPFAWLKERVEDFRLEEKGLEETAWCRVILKQMDIDLEGALGFLTEALALCSRPAGPAPYEGIIQDEIDQLNRLRSSLEEGWSSFYRALADMQFKRLPRCPRDTDETLKEEVQSLRDKAKNIVKDIQGNILVKSLEEYEEELRELYPYMKYLYELVKTFDGLYKELKAERGIIDFNDLEHYTLDILGNEEIANEYRSHYEYIFVDEYQDSNIVQETILGCIKREDNLFMVGDVKQSIYRFRMADPSLFIEKYDRFGDDPSARDLRIDLNRNFRSRPEILDGVNFLFRHIMSPSLGEIDYDEKASLYKGLDMEPIEDPRIELNLIEKGEGPEDLESELEELDDIEMEASIVAQRIKDLLHTRIYDSREQKYRLVEYKDIVVLLRSTKNWAPVFLETFTAAGIPSYADVNTGYFDALEVSIFLNLLKIIDNKRQDIPLLSVMRSSIGGFSPQDLIAIRLAGTAPTFYEAVEEYILQKEDDLKKRLVAFLSMLKEWKKEARYLDIDELIWRLMKDTGYYYYVGAMPGGLQRQANLRILLDRARQFQKTSMKGLFNFIRFIDKLQSSSGDMGTARTLGENDNVVRIMSIHKSKGLEFPVVIVAGLGKHFNLTDTNAQVLLHKDLGIGPRYVNPDTRQMGDTLPQMAMKERIRMENLSEEMRILYVALTRPKDKLILMGAVRNLPNAAMKWAGQVNAYSLSRGRSYLDWICPVLLRHPDGEKLRELVDGGFDTDRWEDPSQWIIRIYNRSHLSVEDNAQPMDKEKIMEYLEAQPLETAEEIAPILEKRFQWSYPYEAATRIPSKLSVTEIKRISSGNTAAMGLDTPALIEKPKFLTGRQDLTAMERGTIIHFVMQHLDIRRVDSLQAIKEQVQEMVAREQLREEDARVVDIQGIYRFFTSPIGQRIVQAPRVYREVPFNLVKKACDVIPGLEDCQEDLLIQGVIDCFFEEGSDLVLVDYKTDYVTEGGRDEVIERYRLQIELYGEALERILNRRVKEKVLYLFHLNEGIRL